MHLSEREVSSLIYGGAAHADSAEHLATCTRCAEKVRIARSLDRTAEDLLALLDHPVPRIDPRTIISRGRRVGGAPIKQIAAGIVLLSIAFGAAAAIPASPVHRLMANMVAKFGWHQEPSSVTRNTEPRSAAIQATRSSSGIVFVPDTALEIVFSQSQPKGVIRVVFVDSPQLTVNSSDGPMSFTLARHRVLADNASSTASFDLSVPKRLQSVSVLIGRDTVLRRMGSDIQTVGIIDGPTSFTLPLSPADRRSPTSYKLR